MGLESATEDRIGHVHTHHDHHHDHGDHGDHDEDHSNDDPDGHDGDHHDHDPHAWLDPQNARIWLGDIANALTAQDPDNAETYRAKAANAALALDTLTADLTAQLAPLNAARFIVFHDAYHYFEARFGLSATAALSLGDAADPGPARIADLRAQGAIR